MNLQKILRLAGALSAVAAAAAVCVVAASFALYAVTEPYLGRAGASAVVAGVFALIAVIVAWVATRKVTPKRGLAPAPEPTPMDRVLGLAKQRPLIALGAAAAATFVLVRNPAMVTALVSAFLAGGASKPDK